MMRMGGCCVCVCVRRFTLNVSHLYAEDAREKPIENCSCV